MNSNNNRLLIVMILLTVFTISSSFTGCFGLFKLSALQVVVPSFAGIFGSFFTASIFMGYVLLKMFFSQSLLLPFMVTCGLPTLGASFYFSRNYFASSYLSELFFRALVPLCAAGIFVVHPIGMASSLYIGLWAIPLLVYAVDVFVFKKRSEIVSLFSRALTATFLAHMIGSCIYLYRFGFTASYWISLIPLVLVERAILASGITAVSLLSMYMQERFRLRVFKAVLSEVKKA